MRNYRERLSVESERVSECISQVNAFVELMGSGDISVTDRQGEILTEQLRVVNEHLDVLRLRMILVGRVNSFESVA